MTHLYCRVDASEAIGIGHFMRCFALAQHWRDQEAPVTFVGSLPQPLDELLASEGISREPVRHVHPHAADLEGSVRTIPTGAVVVLDGYHFDSSYQRALGANRRLLVIDDTGHLDEYFGYALLNQNLGAESIRYAKAPAIRLLGPTYALLRRSFRTRRGPRTSPESIGRILISFGGSDAGNVTLRVLAALDRCREGALEARVVVGPLNPHGRALREFSRDHDWAVLVEGATDLAPEMESADVAIAGSGSICWELAVLGVPSLLLAQAENQVPLGTEMESAGAAFFAGRASSLDDDSIADAVRHLLLARDRWQPMGDAATKIIDGDGVARVTDVLRRGLVRD